MNQICEWVNCNSDATQADTYQNMWFCDDHYSLLGNMTDDYQEKYVDYDELQINRILELINKPNNEKGINNEKH